jgi:hypothetical protein
MKVRLAFFSAALAAAVAPQAAYAVTTLTFEGHTNTLYTAPVVRNGFVIGNPPGQTQSFRELNSAAYALPSNGTGALLNNTDSEIFLRAIDGSAFQLISFDISKATLSPFYNTGTFTVRGFLDGNLIGTIAGPLSLFTTFAGFESNVDNVIFDGSGNLTGAFQLDNIVLGPAAVTAVPEPGTWAMMLLGFGMTGLLARRTAQSPAGRPTLRQCR